MLGQAVHRKLETAPGTSVVVSGYANAAQASADGAKLRTALRAAFGAAGFAFYHADWSGLLRLSARYAAASVPITQAAAFGGIGRPGVLVSGAWPAPPRPGRPVPGALPAGTAALLHLSVGGVLLLHDQVSGHPVEVRLTGLFRTVAGPAGVAYRELDLIDASGASTQGGFTTYGPLIVSPAAFGPALPMFPVAQASWVARPVIASIPVTRITALAASITAEQRPARSCGCCGRWSAPRASPRWWPPTIRRSSTSPTRSCS